MLEPPDAMTKEPTNKRFWPVFGSNGYSVVSVVTVMSVALFGVNEQYDNTNTSA